VNPRHRRIARHRRREKQLITAMGPLAHSAPLGAEVKRFGATYKYCSTFGEAFAGDGTVVLLAPESRGAWTASNPKGSTPVAPRRRKPSTIAKWNRIQRVKVEL
jgi:hypothetical protein